MNTQYNVPQQLLKETTSHVVFPALLKTGRELLTKPQDKRNNPYTNVPQGQPKDDYLNGKKSDLGTTVLVNVIFASGSYTDLNGVLRSWDDIEINNIICSIQQSKKVKKTDIQGREGSVKEYIGKNDYAVSFDGAINGANGIYPIDKAKDLETMLGAPVPIAVACWWLQNFGIDTIVVDDYSLPQIRGEYSTQYFYFSASSDKPVEARINA